VRLPCACPAIRRCLTHRPTRRVRDTPPTPSGRPVSRRLNAHEANMAQQKKKRAAKKKAALVAAAGILAAAGLVDTPPTHETSSTAAATVSQRMPSRRLQPF